MTDEQLKAKLTRIDALMNNVTPGSPEEAEYLALVAEVQAEEDRRFSVCARSSGGGGE